MDRDHQITVPTLYANAPQQQEVPLSAVTHGGPPVPPAKIDHPDTRPTSASTEKTGYEDYSAGESDQYRRGGGVAPPPRARSMRDETHVPSSSRRRGHGSGLDWVIPVTDTGDKAYVVCCPPNLFHVSRFMYL
jgi:hypothetical protein